mmetsp:Transcript_9836/g.24873  ORF Transcript_9836/g.24873 Transcript_9836/m.24873 type:complete len:82 (-) Transcript_9836:561-806(-)
MGATVTVAKNPDCGRTRTYLYEKYLAYSARHCSAAGPESPSKAMTKCLRASSLFVRRSPQARSTTPRDDCIVHAHARWAPR